MFFWLNNNLFVDTLNFILQTRTPKTGNHIPDNHNIMPAVAETYQVKRLLSDLLALSKVKAIILSGRYATRLGSA